MPMLTDLLATMEIRMVPVTTVTPMEPDTTEIPMVLLPTEERVARAALTDQSAEWCAKTARVRARRRPPRREARELILVTDTTLTATTDPATAERDPREVTPTDTIRTVPVTMVTPMEPGTTEIRTVLLLTEEREERDSKPFIFQ